MKTLLKLLSVLGCLAAYGQEFPASETLHEQLETLSEPHSEESEDPGSPDRPDFPIHLNSAGKETLQKSGLFTEFQVYSLLHHMQKNGKLLSIYELQAVDGFEPEFIQAIQPYITISAEGLQIIRDQTGSKKSSLSILARRALQKKRGYLAPAHYLGDPLKLQVKFRHAPLKNLSFGVTMDKDPGEPFFNSYGKKGFDYYSAYLELKDYKLIRKLVVGDYEVSCGQGLVLWNSFSLGKTSDVVNIARYSRGILAHKGADESNFLRGAAISLKKGAFVTDVFGSLRKIDARIDPSRNAISTTDNSGLHRTLSELENKGNVEEHLYGLHCTFKKRFLELGLTGAYARLSEKLAVSYNPSDFFDNVDNYNLNAGFDFYGQVKNVSLFGEIGADRRMNLGSIAGMVISLSSRLSFSLHHRDFEPGYHPVKGKAFSENTSVNNEKADYAGISYKLSRQLLLAVYADFYSFSWLRYGSNAPSSGRDYLARIDYTVSKQLKIYFYIRQKRYEENESEGTIRKHTDVIRKNLRLNIEYAALSFMSFRTRAELTHYYKKRGEEGILLFQDVSFRNQGYGLTLRYALFGSASYNSRIYAFENDLPDVFLTPSFSGKGSRFYVLGRCRLRKNTDLWIKYSSTVLGDRSTIGSGWDEIKGNKSSELGAEIKIAF